MRRRLVGKLTAGFFFKKKDCSNVWLLASVCLNAQAKNQACLNTHFILLHTSSTGSSTPYFELSLIPQCLLLRGERDETSPKPATVLPESSKSDSSSESSRLSSLKTTARTHGNSLLLSRSSSRSRRLSPSLLSMRMITMRPPDACKV